MDFTGPCNPLSDKDFGKCSTPYMLIWAEIRPNKHNDKRRKKVAIFLQVL